MDCVLEELEDDLCSTDRIDPGVSDVLGVIGDFELPLTGEDSVLVLRVSAEPLMLVFAASFLVEGRRRKDFQE